MIRPLLRLICGTRFLKHKRGIEVGAKELGQKKWEVTYQCLRCGAQWKRKRKGKA